MARRRWCGGGGAAAGLGAAGLGGAPRPHRALGKGAAAKEGATYLGELPVHGVDLLLEAGDGRLEARHGVRHFGWLRFAVLALSELLFVTWFLRAESVEVGFWRH